MGKVCTYVVCGVLDRHHRVETESNIFCVVMGETRRGCTRRNGDEDEGIYKYFQVSSVVCVSGSPHVQSLSTFAAVYRRRRTFLSRLPLSLAVDKPLFTCGMN